MPCRPAACPRHKRRPERARRCRPAGPRPAARSGSAAPLHTVRLQIPILLFSLSLAPDPPRLCTGPAPAVPRAAATPALFFQQQKPVRPQVLPGPCARAATCGDRSRSGGAPSDRRCARQSPSAAAWPATRCTASPPTACAADPPRGSAGDCSTLKSPALCCREIFKTLFSKNHSSPPHLYRTTASRAKRVTTTTRQPARNSFKTMKNPIFTRPPVTSAMRPLKSYVCRRFA